MGAIDLVVQIERRRRSPAACSASAAAAIRANAISEGVVFPKFRGDLVACAAGRQGRCTTARRSHRFPRQPARHRRTAARRDGAMDDWPVDALFATIRRAAPFAELSRTVFDGVLDMLSGPLPVRRVRRSSAHA
jgi:ATP-dependent Lhr-like helicase